MMGRIAGVVVCVVAGFLAGWAVRSLMETGPVKTPGGEEGGESRAIVALEEAKARLAVQVESQGRRIRELEADRAALREEVSKRAAEEGGGRKPGFNFQEIASNAARTHLEQRKNRVLEEVGFTEAQRKEMEARLAVEKGEGEGMEGLMQELMRFEEVLRELGTPEQMEAYERFRKEEKRATAEMAAHAEFAQLRTAIKLAPEQEDAVFEALAGLSMEQMDEDAVLEIKAGPGEILEQMTARKKEVMGKVLTPQQMEAYGAMLDQQNEVARKVLESMGPMGRQ